MSTYRYLYDDPYKILAHAIVGLSRPADVLRSLTDDEYLATCIRKETREMDLGGRFIDCIITDILEKKRRMEYMHKLDELAAYFYQCLDKNRLRKEICLVLKELGIDVDFYSTAGNVSAAFT